MMQRISTRLSSLIYLARPLGLAFVGIVLLSLGVAYFVIALYRTIDLPPIFSFLTLQFLDHWTRGIILLLVGVAVLVAGIWQLSGLVVIPYDADQSGDGELLLGYRKELPAPRLAVLSGGAGIMVLASLGSTVRRLTCITPVQDPVEYYYRAASLFNAENVMYVVPTPTRVHVMVELSDGAYYNIKQVPHDTHLAPRHVVSIHLAGDQNGGALADVEVTRQTVETLTEADAIVLGPGSLFESIIPNLLLPSVREAIRASKARKIYICNLMTEPGLTSGFSVGDHIRQITRFGGFTPDYVLVNAQRIEPEIRQLYAAANQAPVYLNPEEYEETIVSATERATARDVVVEGAVLVEADLASSVIQSTASLERPGEVRAVRVLRHDPEKLTAAITELLRRV